MQESKSFNKIYVGLGSIMAGMIAYFSGVINGDSNLVINIISVVVGSPMVYALCVWLSKCLCSAIVNKLSKKRRQ